MFRFCLDAAIFVPKQVTAARRTLNLNEGNLAPRSFYPDCAGKGPESQMETVREKKEVENER